MVILNCSGANNDDIATPNLGDNILSEILSRCPVKSLMRFKCVCRRWRFLIEQDLHFIHLHFSRSKSRPTLLIGTPSSIRHYSPFCLFLAENLFEGGAAQHLLTTSWNCMGMLKPLNGLICFVGSILEGVCIYNVSTREVTPWIKTSINIIEVEEKYDGVEVYLQRNHYLPWYGFGVDPETKEHKLLCVWEILRFKASPDGQDILQSTDQVCEVLTVGHNTWRRINVAPTNQLGQQPVHVNGSLYWLNMKSSDTNPPPNPPMDEFIVAFDFGTENFRWIPIPTYIMDQIRAEFPNHVYLLEIDGRIAISRPKRGVGDKKKISIKMWIFSGDDQSTSSCSSKWIEEENVSMSFDGALGALERYDYFQAIAERRDLIMIKNTRPIDLFSLFYYDRKKKTSKKVEFSPSYHQQIASSCYEIAPFVESLFPVQKQIQQHHHHSQIQTQTPP